MEGFVIKYNDIYDLLWEYKEKLEGLIEKLEACENSVRFFIESESFQGESANAIKSYLNDIHITMLSSFKVTAQNFLDNIVLYKAGYYEIDSSTNFVLPEETIEEFRKKLSNGCTDTKECAGEVYGAVSGISDIFAVSQPDTNGVFRIHEQLEQELLQFISDIETQESNTVKALENSTDLLIESLQACIGKIGTNWTDINHYESNSFYTDTDAYTLAGLSQIFYQQHQDYQEVYEQIWGQEQALKDAAEARETQGIWKTVGGGALIVTGVLCIAATGGAATPIVVAGWGIGGGTVAFGVADSIEGAQDIYYGSMGDIDSTSINQLKDVIFQGNEEAYYFTENVFAFAASAFIPISRASVAGNLTFRSGATIVGKEGISTLAGAGVSDITMNLTDNQTASMLMGMLASGVTAHGLNGLDTRFNISGNKWYSKSAYSEFKKLGIDKQIETFNGLNSEEIYNLVKNSPEAWAVEGYDLITPDNAKDFIKLTTNSAGEVSFNLDWPKYGGYNPSTISSIGNLEGKIPVSRDGGDGGYTMGFGKNADGTYADNSQRAIPKSSAEVSTGTFDVDLYKKTVDIVTSEENMSNKIQKLMELGIEDDVAEDMLKDYNNWKTKPEIVGENNIADGASIAGNSVEAKYGYYGNAAAWDVGDIHMNGGAGQMNTIYSWGTLKEAGIISDVGIAVIN